MTNDIAVRTYSYVADPFRSSIRRNPSAEEIAEYAAKRGLIRDIDYLASCGIVAKSDNKSDHIRFILRLPNRSYLDQIILIYNIVSQPWIDIIADNRTTVQRRHDAAAWVKTDTYASLTKDPAQYMLQPSNGWTEDDIEAYLFATDQFKAMAAEYLDKFADGFV